MLDLTNLKYIKINSITPLLKKELIEFCSSLEKEEFPEALVISSGRGKTLLGLAAIYEKLKKSKKEKLAQKRLRKAEKMILSISRLAQTRVERSIAPVEVTPPALRIGPDVEGVFVRHQITHGSIDAIRKIEEKIASSKGISIDEALEFAATKYAEYSEKIKRRVESKKSRKSVRVVMCSDSRNVLGDIEFENDSIKVDSRAGNANEGKKIDEDIIVVVGHKGYRGCGAVNGACSGHKHGSKGGPLSSITTDVIPESIARFENPNEAAYENVRYQVEEFRKTNPGKTVVGICTDVEEKEARLVSGKKDDLTDSIIGSIKDKLRGTGDMSKQVAGFILVTRNNGESGKGMLNVGPNRCFTVSYEVDEEFRANVPQSALDSAAFAKTNVGSVNQSKIILVMDEKASIATEVARSFASAQPDAFVIPMKAANGKLEILLSERDMERMRKAQLETTVQ
ncbi:MAG: hypothetical protein ACP5N9_03330 [Candidatus Bilamarchaeum sp.]|jgi:carbonic anhydrase